MCAVRPKPGQAGLQAAQAARRAGVRVLVPEKGTHGPGLVHTVNPLSY